MDQGGKGIPPNLDTFCFTFNRISSPGPSLMNPPFQTRGRHSTLIDYRVDSRVADLFDNFGDASSREFIS